MSLLPAAGAAAGAAAGTAAAVGAAAVGAAAAGAGIAASAITETTELAATDGFRLGKALRNGAFVDDVVKWGPFTQEELQTIRDARAHSSPEPPPGVQIENAPSMSMPCSMLAVVGHLVSSEECQMPPVGFFLGILPFTRDTSPACSYASDLSWSPIA